MARLSRWGRGHIAPLAVLGAALFAANLIVSVYRWLPSGSLHPALLPSFELLIAALIALLIVARTGRLYTAAAGGALLATALAAFALGEGAFRLLYARGFVPSADLALVRSAVLLFLPGDGLLTGMLAGFAVAITAILLFAVLFALFLVALLALGSIDRARVVPVAAVFGVVAIGAFLALGPSDSLTAAVVRGFSADDFEVRDFAREEPGGEQPGKEVSGTTEPEYGAPGLRDRDIYKFIIESYGITIFEREEISAQLVPALERFERRLSDDGFHVVSNFIEAPIFGGQSWLAEATFLTGNRIDRQSRYERLLEERPETITGFLREEADYYSLAIKPGTINGPWPEGEEIFGFDEVMTPYGGDFEYDGPWFSFVPIPDQFAIWTAHRRIAELREEGGPAADRPLYLHYQLVSSHTPFNRIPQVIEEWEELGDGSLYYDSDTQYFDNDYLSGTEYVEGYIASIRYVLEVIADYMTRYLDDDNESIFILYGDHQPGSVVTGRGASNSVPIHIVSRDDELLEAWRADYEFVDGIFPNQDYPHLPMSEMFPIVTQIAMQ